MKMTSYTEVYFEALVVYTQGIICIHIYLILLYVYDGYVFTWSALLRFWEGLDFNMLHLNVCDHWLVQGHVTITWAGILSHGMYKYASNIIECEFFLCLHY